MTSRQASAGSDSLLCGSTALSSSEAPRNQSSRSSDGRMPQVWLLSPRRAARRADQAQPSTTKPLTTYIHVAQVAGVGIIES